MNQNYPTLKQVILLFLFVSIAILAGSSLLAPRLGLGTNLWINEYLWILTPSVLFVKFTKMPAKELYKLQKTSGRNILIGMSAAVCMWFFAFFLSKITGLMLDSTFGTIDTSAAVKSAASPNQAILMLIGMLVLAPICEELLFRGVIQSAFEGHNKKFGFAISAIFFGMFHVLNGITEIVPTFLLGLTLGYLVYRTRSIAASITAHLAFNFSAVFINEALKLSVLKTIPMWLPIVSIGGLLIAFLLLYRIKSAEQEQEQLDPVSAVKLMKPGKPTARKYSAGTILLFTLSGIYVVIIGALEIYARRTM